MESRIGYDFDRVRVHDDAHAAASARSIDALAYTTGHHIVFGQGQYQPGSESGRRLLAHELTHTIQQNGPAPSSIMRQQAPPAFGKSCSGGATDPCQATRCLPAQHKSIQADIGRAIGYVNAAISALNASPLTTDTSRALDWFFNSHEPATANQVKTSLGCILACLTDTQTNNRYGCHPDYDALAYTCVGSTPICANVNVDVCFTSQHFGGNDRERAEVVVHECAHRAGMSLGSPNSVPDIYRFTARFANLSTADALQNADSFAMFAGAITGGVRLSVVPLFSAGAGVAAAPGSPATWMFRIYGGAEFQHPVMSIFNPTIGLAYTLIGDPTTPRPGVPNPTPLGLVSLLGGFRLGNPRPGGAGGPYASLFGGPSLAISGAGEVRAGAEAGVSMGYRWRWLDISAGANYDYDPTRKTGGQHIVSGSLNLGFALF
jgi:hypothetical protein